MMITFPFVVFGILRYVLLLNRQEIGEEPDQVLVTDLPILACVAAWALTCGIVLVAG
jgi:hypothetical protein